MKVSVAMTCFNGSKYIIEQLTSLNYQTVKINEVVIIDDHSVDNTANIVEHYIKKNHLDGWTICSNGQNIGWVKNFHQAIQKTTGDIVFFCDQDDVWHKDKIEKMTRILSLSNEMSVLACRVKLIDSQGEILPNKHGYFPFDSRNTKSVKKNVLNSKFLYSISPGCTMAVKRNLISCLYKNDNSKELPHDALFWKAGTYLDCAYILDEALVDYRMHSKNASNPIKSMQKRAKPLEIRLKEVEAFKKDLSHLKLILNELKSNDKYIDTINSISVHLENRENWLKRNNNINSIRYFLKEYHYYKSYKMFIGDVLSRGW